MLPGFSGFGQWPSPVHFVGVPGSKTSHPNTLRIRGVGARFGSRMYLGIVKGTVVAARKAAGLEGTKLLLVQPVDEHGAVVGDLQAAVDRVQAGIGDFVYLVGSREAALACDPWFVPVDAAIVGIVDGVDAPEAAP